MKHCIFLLTLAFLSSCGLYEVDCSEKPVSEGVWGGPIVGESTGLAESVCYMTVMDYKDGYDWRSDQARESVKCSLVVYADGVPVMKVPVGNDYQEGSDPDMHRIIGGHLYTDCSTGSQTVIKKDGIPLFYYDGCESIGGMGIRGDDVYTLGQDRDGNGFTFRKNGEVVVGRERGQIMSNLTEDCDSLCFSFMEQIQNVQGYVDRYYVSVNGKVSQIAVREDIKKVWDVTMNNGQAVYVASLVGISLPVLFSGEQMTSLPLPEGAEMISCNILRAGEQSGAEGIYRGKDGLYYNAVWLGGKLLITFGKGETISAIGTCQGGVFCAVNPVKTGQAGKIYRCGEVFQMPAGYVVMGDECMSMINGILHVGLSSLSGDKPIVWKDGIVETLDVNGYISMVSADDAGQSSQETLRD